MPNPLGRRAIQSASSREVEALKKELEELKDLYRTDMANISADMNLLNSQIAPTANTES
jgi:hypothetical protein